MFKGGWGVEEFVSTRVPTGTATEGAISLRVSRGGEKLVSTRAPSVAEGTACPWVSWESKETVKSFQGGRRDGLSTGSHWGRESRFTRGSQGTRVNRF